MRDNDRAKPLPRLVHHARMLAMGALLGTLAAQSGCVRDSDCGICDPDRLILESISGVNYAQRKINVLDPLCEGNECPGSFNKGTYFIGEIGPCEETMEAQSSPNPAEYCKLSPLMTALGVEFVFNNLLEPTSLELVRKRPDNPQLFEVYDWKPDVVHIEGPLTRFNGDYSVGSGEAPDLITRMVNLSCIDNLRDAGIPFSNADYEDPATNPCNQIDPNTGAPRKLRENGSIDSVRGVTTAFGDSCSTPTEGADTCCSWCDWLLSTKIARYGIDGAGNQLAPNAGTAIACDVTEEDEDPIDDPFETCRSFGIGVDRGDEEKRWEYYWSCQQGTPGCEPELFAVPLADKLRETHPDDRPPWLINRTASCESTAECGETHSLTGTQCIGQKPAGTACLVDVGDPECTQGSCQPQWFVTCRQDVDTTGTATGYCIDRRFGASGTAGCFSAGPNGRFQALCEETEGGGRDCAGTAGPGTNFANCDGNADGRLTSFECCANGLGGPAWDAETEPPLACDPFYQTELVQAAIYQREQNLPEQTRACICKLPADAGCETAVETGCLDSAGNLLPERAGQYAVKFVARPGGVIYDPAIKGFEFRPADVGGIQRADIESCAEDATGGLIGKRNRHDGWRSNDAFIPEIPGDFDRAMCSGQTYTVVFSEPGGELSFIEDKVGNTLEGKSRYTFETPQFHVVPRSGRPDDNLRIGACDDYSLRFSNKVDLSPENLNKLRLFRLDANGDVTTPNADCDDPTIPVAGGPGCFSDKAAFEAAREASQDECPQPCLVVDVRNNGVGELSVSVDSTKFGGAILRTGETYRMVAPTAATLAQGSAPENYPNVLWDACGMPLVAEGAQPYLYDFTIDTPKCSEDADGDGIQRSCDNAERTFNPDQGNIDNDAFGDVVDLCPLIPEASTSNTADSDKDGVGNECDSCRQPLTRYNSNADALGLPDYMRVRNIPYQTDTDRDGIGDVCDNCVLVANCDNFGPDNPYGVGDPIAYDNDAACQQDNDSNMIGNACDNGEVGDNAAGPIGFGPDDDFDQDGLVNLDDRCPRQPVPETIACTDDADCPGNEGLDTPASRCTAGVCNHVDSDDDRVGDICDTCPFNPNENQLTEGAMQEDDPDGDFVGLICETDNECALRPDPRPFSFHEVAANNNCCIVQLMPFSEVVALELLDQAGIDSLEESLERPLFEADLIRTQSLTPLVDPDGISVRVDCSNDEVINGICRRLEPDVLNRPGVVTLPPGCEVALADAGVSAIDNTRRTNNANINLQGDVNEVWSRVCFLPQRDQDFDGIGEACELCPFDYDPSNTRYTDENGRLWPDAGAFCNGEYNIENRCDAAGMGETAGGTDTDTDGGSGSGGGSDTGG